MEKFEKNGVTFTTFEYRGETYLCTGNPTGKLKFEFVGEVADYYSVEGATSFACGKNKTVDELYDAWLKETEFQREILGIQF
jgi:hypothetical protein